MDDETWRYGSGYVAGLRNGAAVAFGMIGMGEAIRSRKALPRCSNCWATKWLTLECGRCGHRSPHPFPEEKP